jgi:dienelactone hydrolase
MLMPRIRLTQFLVGCLAISVPAGLVHYRADLQRKWAIVEPMLQMVPFHRLRICRCHSDREITLTRSDGLHTRASVFGVRSGEQRPGVVIVHGNTPRGRRLPIYRLLATRLAEAGYVVLTLDQIGFGQSDSPFDSGHPEALNTTPDVLAGVEYLAGLAEVDTSFIAVLGHSGGVVPVIRAATCSSAVDAIVAIGPSRRPEVDAHDPAALAGYWERYKRTIREVYGRELPQWVTREMRKQYQIYREIPAYLDYFSQPRHKPLLLMDGERESEADKAWLRLYYAKVAAPKMYATVSGVNHYLNTADFGFQGSILYDAAGAGVSVALIDRWLDAVRTNAAPATPAHRQSGTEVYNHQWPAGGLATDGRLAPDCPR